MVATIPEVGASIAGFFACTEPCEPAAALVIPIPVALCVIPATWSAAGGLLGNRCSAVAPRSVEVFFSSFFGILIAAAEAPAERLRFIKAFVGLVPPTAQPPGRAAWWRWLIIEVRRTPGLFRGDAAEAHTFVGKEHGCSRQQELPELEDRVESPTLEEQNPSTEKADRRKENVVIPCERWLE